MKIVTCKNYEEMSQKAAELIINQVAQKPHSTLGLATGSTPLGLYQELIKAYQDKKISFKDVSSYNLDEYIGITRSHPQSYYQYMYQNLFKSIDIKDENVHIPDNDVKKLDQIAKMYNDQLNQAQIDLQILGIGSNGHIGFNEPGTPLDAETFIVTLDQQTRLDNQRFFNSLDEVPQYAITMGIKNIMKSKKIILLASGVEKSEAIYKMIHKNVSVDCPASVLQLHPDVTVIIDEKAASKL